MAAINVVKKDLTHEDFIPAKITDAVLKAAMRCDFELKDEELAGVVDEVRASLRERDLVTVTELHEHVVAALDTLGHRAVAKAYSEYRYYKTHFAQTFDKLRVDADDVLRLGDRENANFDSSLVSTKGSLIKGYLTKSLYKQESVISMEKPILTSGRRADNSVW